MRQTSHAWAAQGCSSTHTPSLDATELAYSNEAPERKSVKARRWGAPAQPARSSQGG